VRIAGTGADAVYSNSADAEQFLSIKEPCCAVSHSGPTCNYSL
jgi:hypothetical protein